jgi:hypothetical protein
LPSNSDGELKKRITHWWLNHGTFEGLNKDTPDDILDEAKKEFPLTAVFKVMAKDTGTPKLTLTKDQEVFARWFKKWFGDVTAQQQT